MKLLGRYNKLMDDMEANEVDAISVDVVRLMIEDIAEKVMEDQRLRLRIIAN